MVSLVSCSSARYIGRFIQVIGTIGSNMVTPAETWFSDCFYLVLSENVTHQVLYGLLTILQFQPYLGAQDPTQQVWYVGDYCGVIIGVGDYVGDYFGVIIHDEQSQVPLTTSF